MELISFDLLVPGDLWTYAPSPSAGWEADAVTNPVFQVLEVTVHDNCTRREFGRAMRVRRYNDHKNRFYRPPTIINHMPLTQRVWLLYEPDRVITITGASPSVTIPFTRKAIRAQRPYRVNVEET